MCVATFVALSAHPPTGRHALLRHDPHNGDRGRLGSLGREGSHNRVHGRTIAAVWKQRKTLGHSNFGLPSQQSGRTLTPNPSPASQERGALPATRSPSPAERERG